MKRSFFAVDLGATSGRTIVGSVSDKGVELEELSHYPNRMIEVRGCLLGYICSLSVYYSDI